MFLIRCFAIAAMIFAPALTQAEDYIHPGIFKSANLYLDQGAGLITNIPCHEHAEVVRQVKSYRNELETVVEQATEVAEHSHFSTMDTLLTIILPGGLLYAANRQQHYSKAHERLGWTPKITFEEMVQEMMEADLELAKRDDLVEREGYKAFKYYE